jgi:hypothetical protein
MKRYALVLSVALLASPMASAQEPTGKVYFGRNMEWTSNCYPSVYRGPDGKLYYRRVECPGDGMKYSDIGMPVDGFFNNALRKATHPSRARVLPNGMIELR